MDKLTLNITGMTCDHCSGRVTKAIADVPGVETAIVELEEGIAHVTGTPDLAALKSAVAAAGYAIAD